MISVLLVEDHASYAQALESVFRTTEDLRLRSHVTRGDAALDAVAAAEPDLVVIDLDLPGASGLDALAAVRGARPSTPCVILTALTDDAELGRAIELGAAAVLHKSLDVGALLEDLRIVAAGGTVLPPESTSRRLQALAAERNERWHARTLVDALSPRELEVLDRLVEGDRTEDIAAALGISVQTVQTHVRNLLAKLGVGSRLEAVVKAIRLGLSHPPR
jgi:DNA-binding NarL/FixJ family response regulator